MNILLACLGTVFFAALAVSILVVASNQVPVEPPAAVISKEPAAKAQAATSKQSPLRTLNTSARDDITARPLFSETRRPKAQNRAKVAPKPKPVTKTAKPIPQPDIRLMGALINEARSLAFISLSEEPGEWYELGSIIAGWELSSINSQGIELTEGRRKMSVELYTRGNR